MAGQEQPNVDDKARAVILADLLKHYSSLRFVILPLAGAAVVWPVYLATEIDDPPRLALSLLALGASVVFGVPLWRVQDLIDELSVKLTAMVDTPHSPKRSQVLRLATAAGLAAVAALSVWIIWAIP